MRLQITVIALMLILQPGCTADKEKADLILTNGVVYTVDKDFSVAGAVAIRDRRIIEVGSSEDISEKYKAERVKDLKGAFVYPGWIDAHCHFFGYGMNLNAVDLTETASVEEIIERVKKKRESFRGSWITGRGWDQNDWEIKEFPDRSMLDAHFPDIPILLRRIDGHAAWVNTKALELAGVTAASAVDGGAIVLNEGEPSGILIDNAISLVESMIPAASQKEIIEALRHAEKNCFSVGLTSVQDAGLGKPVVQLIDSLNRDGSLKIRINAWLSPSDENFNHFVEKGTYQTDHLSVNTIKLFADGALGSRGARLLQPYSDDPGNYGLLVTAPETLVNLCRKAYVNNYAVATHCIGDAANHEILKIYASILGGRNDRRWRIEHAQIIDPGDFHMFGDYSIVPSVQPTHATSDMYWAEKRIGSERMKGAYAYRTLLEQNGWIAGGSDFPVESINPLYGFYAATVRKDQSGYPEGGFRMEESISREDALRAMTIWAAKAGFEEHLKGSLEPGKLADMVVTRVDLLNAPDEELFNIRVIETYSGGELVYEASE